MIGPASLGPLIGARALESALRPDDEIVGIRMQRLGDDLLGHVRPVRVCGIVVVDAQLDGASQYTHCLATVRRFAPHAATGNAHRAIAHAVDGEITKINRAGEAGAGSLSLCHVRRSDSLSAYMSRAIFG